MTTPRTTRLVRVATLRDFRRTLLAYGACDVPTARTTAILVPTHAAAEQLRRGFETAAGDGVVVPPHVMTRQDWMSWLSLHVAQAPPLLSAFEREVLLEASARAAALGGTPPPFSLRPTLIGEMLAFYDTFRRQLRSVDDFDRLSASRFGGDTDDDRGAVRMLAQARFMVASFREYETRLAVLGRADEHVMRGHLLAADDTPIRRVVVSVGDRAGDVSGLCAADFDLLARLNGITAIDVVATEAALAAGFLVRLRQHLPGIAETRDEGGALSPSPVLEIPAAEDGARHFLHRDREDELAWVVRRTKALFREHPGARLDRTAVVFKRPLPYVYLARRAFGSAGMPYEAVDTLPLASEPAAAALDLVVENISTGFDRASLTALLRSPHFHFESGGTPVTPTAVSLFDRALSEHRYLGGADDLGRLIESWQRDPADGPAGRDHWKRDVLARTGAAAAAAIAELTALLSPAAPSDHLDTLLGFLRAHDRVPSTDDDVRRRHLRARAAVTGTLANLRDAFRAFDAPPRPFEDTAASLRQWIERQTFAPRVGGAGVVVTDAHAARYGDFDRVYLVGATQHDWPEAAPRRIFFPLSMLTDLGWPEEADGRAYDRAAFLDLLRLPVGRVAVSTFTLEDDTIVEPSPFLEDLADAGLPTERDRMAALPRVFVSEALTADPVPQEALEGTAAGWLTLRMSRTPADDARFHGQGRPTAPAAYKVSALDRFLECPFVYFSEQVLRLKEEPEDEEGLSPRTQGKVLHEIFEAFFRAWQEAGHGAITTGTLDEARRLFGDVVEARLALMPAGDAAIERTRLMGSPVAPGLGDIVLGLEAEQRGEVVERLLEFPLGGDAVFRAADGDRRIALRATADRVDLLADGTFRVFDYKLTKPPALKTAVQLPAYAAAARARLEGRLGRSWRPTDAAYVAFGKPPYYKPLAADPDKLDQALVDGERRLADAVERIEGGMFPPQPFTRHRCSYCPFVPVCRKDYVDGEA